MPEDQLIPYLIERINRIDGKVDKLLAFKWQVVGGSIVTSIFLTLAIQAYFKS